MIALLCGSATRVAAAPQASQQIQELRSDDEVVVTHHQITIDAKPLKYTARAGYLTLRDHAREARAKIFFVAYTLDRASGDSPRPLTFAWNGGPGSPSSMIQMGAVGPRRLKLPDEYAKKPPPYELVDNESTWLTGTDLVFVDPVGTGYSYPIKPEYGKEFWSVQGDIDSIGEFIRIYRMRYERLSSPLFIAGESYGTVRAAGLSEALEKRDIPLTGVILISSILNRTASEFAVGNDIPYVLILPSYTATAFAHKKLPGDLSSDFQGTLQKAQFWAESEYAAALMKGDRISASEREATAKQLARYTGLDPKVIEKNNLRINMEQFTLHLLQDQQEVVAHYDSRMSSKSTGPGEYNPATDPSLSGNGLSDLFVPYLRNDLDFKTDAFYAGPFTYGWPPATTPRGDWLAVLWDFGSGRDSGDQGGGALAKALHENSALHVFSASGYYDLATPYFATQYSLDHLGLSADERSRVEIKVYPGGHMLYFSGDNLKQLKQDVAKFLEAAISK
jgi:carboxypeptidase C (cathepsin A)